MLARAGGAPCVHEPRMTSAATQPSLTAYARLVCQSIVLKDRLFLGRQQLAVGLERRCILHLLLGEGDLEIPRTDSRARA